MAAIKTCSTNLLEAGTVTLTAGAAAAGYPLYRLHDRDLGRLFIGSAAATTTVHLDQGASPAACDRLLIPSGHNLAGVGLVLQHSPDNAIWTAAVTGWTGAAGDIIKEWTTVTKRYWRFTATTPAAAPQIGELFLSPTVTWTRSPSRPGGAQEALHNVTVAVTAEGRVRFEVNGPSLRQRNYTLKGLTSAQRVEFEALWTAFAGSKPFWLASDHEGTAIFGRFVAQPQLRETAPGTFDATFNFLEVPA